MKGSPAPGKSLGVPANQITDLPTFNGKEPGLILSDGNSSGESVFEIELN